MKPIITFALHDAGETNALRPAMQQLDRVHYPYAILADGTAKRLLGQQNPHLVTGDRFHPSVTEALSAPTLITGDVSIQQARWASLFALAKKRVIAYHDSLTEPKQQHPLYQVGRWVTDWWAPSKQTAAFFQTQFPGQNTQAVGPPALTLTRLSGSDKVQAKQLLGLPANKPVIVFIGGYGPHYEDSLKLLLDVSQSLDAQVVLAPHPKTRGVVERDYLAKAPYPNVRLCPEASTQRLLSVADVACCQGSSLALNCLMSELPVTYIGQAVQTDATDPLEQWIPRATTIESLKQQLGQQLIQPATPAPQEVERTLGLQQEDTLAKAILALAEKSLDV